MFELPVLWVVSPMRASSGPTCATGIVHSVHQADDHIAIQKVQKLLYISICITT